MNLTKLLGRLHKCKQVIKAIDEWSSRKDLLPPAIDDKYIMPGISVPKLNPAYRIEHRSIGYDFDFQVVNIWRIGYPTFWVTHLESGASAKFGLSDKVENPLLTNP